VLLDYHMHLAPDGARLGPSELSLAHVRRYVEAAHARGVDEIGFSEHVYRFAAAAAASPHEYWQAQATDDLAAYRRLLDEAAAAGLPVRAGIELDWLEGGLGTLRSIAEDWRWDYVLGSVHWLGEWAVDHPDYAVWEHADVDTVWRRYAATLCEAAASGLYDVMAHADLAKVFGHRPAPATVVRVHDELVEAFAAADVCVEVSTAGLRKPARELYPAAALLSACWRAGIPATLGSDAHVPGDVGRDFGVALRALTDAGYREITRYRGRRREQVPLTDA
jgi:histidinol-phosphatase (PHP family)